MIKYTRFFITLLFAVIAFAAHSQSTATSSSPYSRYGIGDIDPQLMPQNAGMGGIGVATNRMSFFNNINVINPASYGAINLTTIDIGLYGSFLNLSQTGAASQRNNNFRLSHVAFAIPVSKRSALSFGLLPYSERGYNYTKSVKGTGTIPADTNITNYSYSGDGSLSKAYLGYGFGLGKHLLLGGNVSYIFGTLKDIGTTEIPNLIGTINSRIEQSNAISGLNYDYGIQYSVDFSENKHLTFGYSGSVGSKLNSQSSFIVSQYFTDASGNQDVPADSVINRQSAKTKIKLPQTNRFGISFQNEGKFLVGADYTMSNWSDFSIGGESQGLQNSRTFNIGGQYTPNLQTLRNYLASVDYRLGAIYDETYMVVNNTRIKRYAVTAGLGLPLRPNNGSFYKINISAEVGKRGSLVNGLVKENYINIHLGFTLNDRWFQKYKFD
ncbi:hypothetical protein SNE25_29880 [Mucilaginibacter sabulilitoris]|uniref:Long-chain fatty acid transport protein n=1 Tax=Mucilaginibacter sabulilitoris TaxID=1173583 RepID=A0ABZ0TPW1_9SPHI|nr:hypothetical protein [Mucilaginibacter sabulilitoris]WPU93530.1 hypothetical protein SNE25_29880 [Mucilaginibacter sabulilitoris]